MKKYYGFTLIELMVVLIVIAIFAAIAIPSYQQYMRKRDLAVAQQVSLRIASELERFRSKNFSYKGFNPDYLYSDYDSDNGELYLPEGSDSTNAKYLLTLVDGTTQTPLSIELDDDGNETISSESVTGLNWSMKAIPLNTEYDAILLTSIGVRCARTYITDNDLTDIDAYIGCGDDAKKW